MSVASATLHDVVNLCVAADCGNAPKRLVLRDYVLAVAERDVDAIAAALADDVVWEIVGRSTTMKDDFASTVDQLFKGAVDTLSIESILTHGKEGCVAGTMVLADGRSIRFCDVYLFNGHSKTAKIKKITSYLIDVE